VKVYREGDQEPNDVSYVIDASGHAWYPMLDGSGRWGEAVGARATWHALLELLGPLRVGEEVY
jgi:hypothetical protein